MNVVENIDAYCKAKGISNKAFERLCGIYHPAIKRWRTGVQSPTMRTMDRIVAATGIPLEKWMEKGGVNACNENPRKDGGERRICRKDGEVVEDHNTVME